MLFLFYCFVFCSLVCFVRTSLILLSLILSSSFLFSSFSFSSSGVVCFDLTNSRSSLSRARDILRRVAEQDQPNSVTTLVLAGCKADAASPAQLEEGAFVFLLPRLFFLLFLQAWPRPPRWASKCRSLWSRPPLLCSPLLLLITSYLSSSLQPEHVIVFSSLLLLLFR